MAQNKVAYGIKNAHYALLTENADGTITYGTPVPMPGSVELSLEARGDLVEFYADNMLYYSGQNNQGYNGTLTIALIPESFAVDVLGEEKDTNDNVLIERNTAKGKPFAFLFEFDGDVKATRHVMYKCTANRPSLSGSTTTDTADPQPNELTFLSYARPTDNAVKTKTTPDTPAGVYDNWYSTVYDQNPVAVTSVTVVPDTVNLAVSDIQQLGTTVLPSDATNKQVNYTSSDETIATVSADGLVTAVAVGSATITVTTADGGFMDTCAVTVA